MINTLFCVCFRQKQQRGEHHSFWKTISAETWQKGPGRAGLHMAHTVWMLLVKRQSLWAEVNSILRVEFPETLFPPFLDAGPLLFCSNVRSWGSFSPQQEAGGWACSMSVYPKKLLAAVFVIQTETWTLGQPVITDVNCQPASWEDVSNLSNIKNYCSWGCWGRGGSGLWNAITLFGINFASLFLLDIFDSCEFI